MSTENAVETEVKIRVLDWDGGLAGARMAGVGLGVSVGRVFEDNWVFDTEALTIRTGGMLLRLRRVGERNILTWKGPSVVGGPHKSRPELEVGFDEFETMAEILGHLGYAPVFRYEKYRTEFSAPGQGTVTFDETPIGNFLELEGQAEWIDAMAAKLGFKQGDYVLDSYAKLYFADCEKRGVQPLNMIFPLKS